MIHLTTWPFLILSLLGHWRSHCIADARSLSVFRMGLNQVKTGIPFVKDRVFFSNHNTKIALYDIDGLVARFLLTERVHSRSLQSNLPNPK
ncbi:hypothetical protein PM082_010396 [Marasmius tenuissimus]|nr:hypothetical protein PM082_010396 [Marasmius tenuissimus]